MPTSFESREVWDRFEWPQHGEEWSRPYGNTETLWWFIIMPRIHQFLPAVHIVDLGCGQGRFMRFLRHHCKRLTGVDLSSRAINHCRQQFEDDSRLEFHVNDGATLPMIPSASVDFIFSYDSLIHAEADAMASYLREFRRILKPAGAGFIHHSNLGQYSGRLAIYDMLRKTTPASWWRPGLRDATLAQKALQLALSLNTAGWRAPSMTAARFRELSREAGLYTPTQETINWGYGSCATDCLSVVTMRPAPELPLFHNAGVRREAGTLRRLSPMYSRARS
jgi:ubiquinone/menaquinone biosynthesis C-methylase UbiE